MGDSMEIVTAQDSPELRSALAEIAERLPPELAIKGLPNFPAVYTVLKGLEQAARFEATKEVADHCFPAIAVALQRFRDDIPPDFVRTIRKGRRELADGIGAVLRGPMRLESQFTIIGWRFCETCLLLYECDDPGKIPPVMASFLDTLDALAAAVALFAERVGSWDEVANRHQRRVAGRQGGLRKSSRLDEVKEAVFKDAKRIQGKKKIKISANKLANQITTKFQNTPDLAALIAEKAMSWDQFPATVAGWLRKGEIPLHAK